MKVGARVEAMARCGAKRLSEGEGGGKGEGGGEGGVTARGAVRVRVRYTCSGGVRWGSRR